MHRIKHIESGLYYQPGKNNFSEKGKVYFTNRDALSDNFNSVTISMDKDSRIVKKYPDLFKDWKEYHSRYLVKFLLKTNLFVKP